MATEGWVWLNCRRCEVVGTTARTGRAGKAEGDVVGGDRPVMWAEAARVATAVGPVVAMAVFAVCSRVRRSA